MWQCETCDEKFETEEDLATHQAAIPFYIAARSRLTDKQWEAMIASRPRITVRHTDGSASKVMEIDTATKPAEDYE